MKNKAAKQNHSSRTRKLLQDRRGLSTVEYIIILVLVAVAGITLWQEFGGAVMDRISESTSAIEGM